MDLFRDLLDKQVLDRHKTRMGKVDGLCGMLHEEGPPEVAAIAIGAVTVANRLHPRLARWMARLEEVGPGPGMAEPVRLPCHTIRDVGIDVEVAVDAHETHALGWEAWLRDRVLAYLPWSGAKRVVARRRAA